MFWVGMLQEHGHSLVYNIREWERILIYVAKGDQRVTGYMLLKGIKSNWFTYYCN